MKRILFILFLLLSIVPNAPAQSVTVAVAANMSSAAEALKTVFENDTGHTVEIITGSSGKLSAQIKNGAPFDVFLSADMEYPEGLFKDGFALEKPKVYAYGVLILWTFADLDLTKGLDVFKNDGIKKIALATPSLAPYGRQAVNALKYFDVYSDVESKIVYGENVSQVNQFITTRAADIGFTSKSTVMAGPMKGQGKWAEVAPKAYQPIAQGVLLLKHAQGNPIARQFYEFLFSEKTKNILKENGYQNDPS